MGSQPLSPKRTRFYERKTGLSLDRVLSHGGSDHWFSFRTPEHRHGSFRIFPEVVAIEWRGLRDSFHWTTCKERFPLDFEQDPPYRYIGPYYGLCRHHGWRQYIPGSRGSVQLQPVSLRPHDDVATFRLLPRLDQEAAAQRSHPRIHPSISAGRVLEVTVKCRLCGGDIPLFGCVLWCNECIEEFLSSKESIYEFVSRKKSS